MVSLVRCRRNENFNKVVFGYMKIWDYKEQFNVALIDHLWMLSSLNFAKQISTQLYTHQFQWAWTEDRDPKSLHDPDLLWFRRLAAWKLWFIFVSDHKVHLFWRVKTRVIILPYLKCKKNIIQTVSVISSSKYMASIFF